MRWIARVYGTRKRGGDLCLLLYPLYRAQAYIEGYHTVPKGRCRQVVTGMAWLFFVSWVSTRGMHPQSQLVAFQL